MLTILEIEKQEEETRAEWRKDLKSSEKSRINSRLTFLKNARLALIAGTNEESLKRQLGLIEIQLNRLDEALSKPPKLQGDTLRQMVRDTKKEYRLAELETQRRMINFLLNH
jgi:hypothetical protein